MTLLTRKGANAILRKIYETGGLKPDMEEDIKRLQDDFDEREGILRRYGDVYDGEDQEEYEYKGRDVSELDVDEAAQWRSKYEDMRGRYLDRFFGGGDVKDEVEDILEDQEEDVKKDGRPQTFEELLLASEG